MNKLENIRLDEYEKNALLFAINDINDEVFLFGSRTYPDKKGGDIDIMIFSKNDSLKLSMEIRRRFFMQCEEKIDVLVLDKENLSEENKSFINTLNLIKIK